MFRILTVAREYGSGGAKVAQIVAGRLGWKLLDRCLGEEIAEAARIDPRLAERFDEHPDPWIERLANLLWQYPGGRGYISGPLPERFDADRAAEMARRIIDEAAEIGDCVIVGRASQCILQPRADAFHVFVYAPKQERVERLRKRDPGLSVAAAEKKMEDEDAARAAYVRAQFGCDWQNRHLYHLMVSSSMGEKEAASVILSALHCAEVGAAAR
jgi:cytidylate kinase